MDSFVPILVLIALFYFFGRLKKIPMHVKSTPALEIECPAAYDLVIRLNGAELIKLDKHTRSKKNQNVIKSKEGIKEKEYLIDISDVVSMNDDHFTIEFDYSLDRSKQGNTQYIRPQAEFDYVIAYIDDGKLIGDVDVVEKRIPLEATSGRAQVKFDQIYEKAKAKDRRRRGVK